MAATKPERRRVLRALVPLLTLALLGAGCGSSTSSYVHPNVDFGYVQRVAVLPFGNLSSDRLAGERMQSIFLIEILKENVLDIVDSRETATTMVAAGYTPGQQLTPNEAINLGAKLGVDALIFGVVEEYGFSRGDRRRGPEITASFGMVETETGALIWRANVHETGSSFWKRLFGGGTDDLYTVSRKVVSEALKTLL